MARWSNPSSGLTQDRFRVWSTPDDLYSRAELEENWDTLDAILGRPLDGVTVWPPLAERGVGKGIWLYIQKLQAEKPKLGDLKWVWAPTQAALSASITAQQAAGWEVANGQSISAANHDLETLDGTLTGSIRLPNLVGHYITGVAHDSTVGTSGGITTHNGTSNVGTQGSNSSSFALSIPAHTHTIPSHTHSLPGHQHGMHHRHYMYHDDIVNGFGQDVITAPKQTSTSRFGIVYRLRSSAIADSQIYDATDDGYIASEPGWDHPVPHANHRHRLNETATGLPLRGPTGGVKLVLNTDVGGSGTSGAYSGTSGSSGAFSQDINTDNKPLSVGMVPFIKVRNASGI